MCTVEEEGGGIMWVGRGFLHENVGFIILSFFAFLFVMKVVLLVFEIVVFLLLFLFVL